MAGQLQQLALEAGVRGAELRGALGELVVLELEAVHRLVQVVDLVVVRW